VVVLVVGLEWQIVSVGALLSGQPQVLTEESVQILLGELHHEQVEAGVEEVGRLLRVAAHLALSLTEPSLGVEEISVRAAEDSVRTQQPWRYLLADVELGAGGLLAVVAGLAAGVEGAHGDHELRLGGGRCGGDRLGSGHRGGV